MNEALHLAEAQTQVGVRCWAYYWTSFRCLIERDFARAGALANRGSSLATEHGIKLWATITQLSQGAALVIADPSRAVDLIRIALVRAEAIPWPQFHPIYLCFKAEALLALGRVVEARADVDRALAMAVSPGLTWWDAELHRIRRGDPRRGRRRSGGARCARPCRSNSGTTGVRDVPPPRGSGYACYLTALYQSGHSVL
jgi:predicted ATPase